MYQVQLSEKLYREAEHRRARRDSRRWMNTLPTLSATIWRTILWWRHRTSIICLRPRGSRRLTQAQEQIKAGNFYTAEQVREHFKRKRAEWEKENPRS